MPESSDDTSDSTPSLLRLDTAPFTLTADGQLSGLNERPTVDLTFETGATDLAEIAAFVPDASRPLSGFNPRGSVGLRAPSRGRCPTKRTLRLRSPPP